MQRQQKARTGSEKDLKSKPVHSDEARTRHRAKRLCFAHSRGPSLPRTDNHCIAKLAELEVLRLQAI